MALTDQERGKRIRELRESANLSLRDFGDIAGINYGTLQGWETKGKHVTIPERRKIADALGITLERLEMTDVENDVKELTHLLDKGWMPKKAIILSESYIEVALGASERFHATGLHARALLANGLMDDAEQHFAEAFELSKKLTSREKRLGIQNFGSFYGIIKDYGKMCNLVAKANAEKMFSDDSFSNGVLAQFEGLCAFVTGNLQLAQKLYEKSFRFYDEASKNSPTEHDQKEAGKKAGWVQVNLADIEFENGNYDRALELLQFAEFRTRDDNTYIQTIIDKDMARVYKVQNKHDKAIAKIEQRLKQNSALGVEYIEIMCKMLLMKAEMTNDATLAETIFKDTNGVSQEVKGWAAKFLTNYYMNVNFDLEKMRLYFSIAEKNLSAKRHY